MTFSARTVLDDCREQLKELDPSVLHPRWRRNCVLIFALLRTVGHVLDKVDSQRSTSLRQATDAWWKQIKQNKDGHAVFWNFIESERNSIIKEYATSARQIVAIQVGAVNYDARTARQWSDPPQVTQHYQRITSGKFVGRDLQDVVEEAIQWWETQLNEIDRLSNSAA